LLWRDCTSLDLGAASKCGLEMRNGFALRFKLQVRGLGAAQAKRKMETGGTPVLLTAFLLFMRCGCSTSQIQIKTYGKYLVGSG